MYSGMDPQASEEERKLSCESAPRSSPAPAEENGKEYLTVDDMLVKHVGEFGCAQLCHFVLVSFAWTVEAFHSLVMIFGDRVPEWHCLPQHSSGMLPIGGINDTLSSSSSCTASSQLCELERGAWDWVGQSSQSTVSEWDLICGEEYKVGLAGSLFFIGVLFGAGIYGNLSDSFFGRKGSLVFACITTVTLGLLTSLASSYWIYATLRFMTGLNAGGIGLCSFVLATEIVGPHKRGSVGMSAFYFFSTGIMLLSFFGYFSSSWRFLYIATAMPGLAYCALVLPFVWESPRWYLVKGRLGDAMRVLRAIAKWNGVTLPDNVHLRLDYNDEDEEKVAEEGENNGVSGASTESFGEEAPLISARTTLQPRFSGTRAVTVDEGKDERGDDEEDVQKQQSVGSLVDVFRNGETRWRMLIMVCVWCFTGVVYYGISLNVVNLGFNLYVSVFVNGLIEVPAFAITAILLGKLGRKAMLVSAMTLSGCCCLLGSFFFILDRPDGLELGGKGFSLGRSSKEIGSGRIYLQQFDIADSRLLSSGMLMGLLRLSCGVLGIFGMAGTYNLIYIYTTELFPTVVRNAALGLASQAAGIGSVIAPFIVVVGHFAPSLPFMLFGVLALAGAALASRLPETLNQPLYDTMEGMERTDSTKLDRPAELPSLGEANSQIVVESSPRSSLLKV